MPKPLNNELISESSILSLIGITKANFDEIRIKTLLIQQSLCREDLTLLKKNLSSETVTTLETLATELKSLSEQQITQPFEVSNILYMKGHISKLYAFLELIEKKYQKVFHGLNLEEKSIIKCLEEITTFNKDNQKIDENGLFSKTLQSLNQSLLDCSIDGQPDSLRIILTEHKANQNSYTLVLSNFEKVIFEIRNRLAIGLCRLLIDDIFVADLFKNPILDTKQMMEILLQDKSMAERIKIIQPLLIDFPLSLWSFKNVYQTTFDLTEKIDLLHNKVHRLQFYNQFLNPSISFVTGLCMGGIRYWSTLPIPKLEAIKNLKKPTYQQHMKWVDNVKIYHYQLNQGSFDTIKNSSDHYLFKILSKTLPAYIEQPKVEPLQIININNSTSEKEKSEQTLSPNGTSNAKEELTQTINTNGTNAKENDVIITTLPEVKLQKEGFQLFIDSMFDEISKLIKLFPENKTTIEIHFLDPTYKVSGHAVGFKYHRIGNTLYYFFCDFNAGEFYSEDFEALKTWFKDYFQLIGYHKFNYCQFELNAILQKDIKQKVSNLLSEYNNTLNLPSNMESKASVEKETAALQYYYKCSKLGKNTQAESEDEINSNKIKNLSTESDNQNEIETQETHLKIVNLYEKIKNKTAQDHLIAWMSANDISESLQGLGNDLPKIIQYVNLAYDCVNRLKQMNVNYTKLLENVVLIQRARFFLKFPSLNKKEEGLKDLKTFCENVALLTKQDFQEAEEGYPKMQGLRDQLLKVLGEGMDIAQILRVAEEVDESLSHQSTFLTPALIDIWVSAFYGNVDTVAVENKETQDTEKSLELGEPSETENACETTENSDSIVSDDSQETLNMASKVKI